MAKCKKCEKEAVPGEEYCVSCRESQNWKVKKVWEMFVGVGLFVGGVLVTIFAGKNSDGGTSDA